MIRGIEHIGIAVEDLEAAAAAWSAALGLPAGPAEEVASQGIRTRPLEVGGTRLELLAATDPSSPIARFLERSGPGVHHVAFAADDLEAARARMVAAGFEPVGAPSRGAGGLAVQFFHPRSTGGVLVEICARERA